MKKLFSLLLSALLVLSLFSGCKNNNETVDDGRVKVVTTIFPPYDITRQVAGDKADIHMLLPSGSESHSFEPTPQDITRINKADVFIYIGGESDSWVDQILQSVDNENLKVVKLIDYVDTLSEEQVEGMQDDGHDHSHDNDHFEDNEVTDRPLSDWSGDWQSVYPYLEDGTLKEVMEQKAEASKGTAEEKTADQYYEYYKKGYQTKVEKIKINDNTMSFTINGKTIKATYEYKGFQIFTYESGSKGVRYQFEAKGNSEGAPKFVQFSDHAISSEKSEHFHIYFGDESFEELNKELENWPTYYPANLSGTQIKEEMLAHESSHNSESKETAKTNELSLTPVIAELDEDGNLKEPKTDENGVGTFSAPVNNKASNDGLLRDESGKIIPKTARTPAKGPIDEHIWTSPVNAKAMALVIAQTLEEADPENKETYQANVENYSKQLDELDSSFKDVVKNAKRKTIMVADRFPFRYLADRYGLTYFAAFPGCATECDASPATVAFLINKMKDEKIPVVFHIEFSNEKMADTIAEETGATKKLLHSTHNVTKEDFDNGITYLDLMKQNVETLKEALQ